jgi:hypothetical protein
MDNGLGQAIRADHQQSRGVVALAEDREQIDGRRVAPVQVLKNEHEWRFVRQLFHEGGKLPQHAFGSDELEGPLQGLRLVLTDQPWRLRQPRRRHPAEQAAQAAGVEPARQPPERLEHCHVRLAQSDLLDAGSTCDHGCCTDLWRGEKGLD